MEELIKFYKSHYYAHLSVFWLIKNKIECKLKKEKDLKFVKLTTCSILLPV